MLLRLSIQNYAIIDKLEINFPGGLNIITGETGAGKSIIMGALGLILGERADTSVLLNTGKKCIVEGFFGANDNKKVQDFLSNNELDTGEEVVVRREIGTNGKSRAFINDTPTTLGQLQLLRALLVDLHQQFDTLQLGETGFQREVLDALAGQNKVILQYQKLYERWKSAKHELEQLISRKNEFEKEHDYIQFQYNELEEAGFAENELEELDAELKLQSNAEGIKTAITNASFELEEGESPVVQKLKSILHQLDSWVEYHPSLATIIQRLQSARIEIQDIAGELAQLGDRVQYDPKRIDAINEKLSVGYKLQKKHGVHGTNELLEVKRYLEEKLRAVLDIDGMIIQKKSEASEILKEAEELAQRISASRSKTATPFESKVNTLLTQVGMPNAVLKVSVKKQDVLNPHGCDEIEFLFDANRSGQYLPVAKVASGGELGRLMLCIKSLVARSIDLPIMIFDEIDTGISGEAARQVGMIMKDLARTRQVICITHQPQIAGRGDAHYFVYKEIVSNAVKTNIRRLSQEERITAIAQMLSGEKPTAAALENAREMVMN